MDINIEASSKTPLIKTNLADGKVEISGRSIPENSIDFYKPLLDALTHFAENPSASAELNVYLDYFNTSSSKCLLDVFKLFEQVHAKNSSTVIVWKYDEDDEDMQEAGKDYQSILNVPFRFEEIAE
ncbi:MAG: nuclear pore complex subunit [Marinilabiliales bacterium]|nr:MAG: nuclear pore complex subunit [Marinilabiliales bacterium]